MTTFSVKNYERFQHYKDRSPPWIKLYNELLDDYEFARLQDASKLHLILIWLLASRSDNVLPYDAGWIGKRINATSKVDLDALRKAGFILVNQTLQQAEQVASTPLAPCKQDARPEREGETEKRDNFLNGHAEEFEQFWFAYPRKVGKKQAMKAYATAVKETKAETILAAIEKQKPTWKDPQFIPHPATWLNRGSWDDEPSKSLSDFENWKSHIV